MDAFCEKFILNFTPTGLIPTKEMTPHVPVKPKEIIEQVLEVAELGVNMVHLHAREPETGEPTYKKEIYGEIISGIRAGIEDNIYYDRKRSHLALNSELIERVLVVAKALGRKPYSRKEAREVLCGR